MGPDMDNPDAPLPQRIEVGVSWRRRAKCVEQTDAEEEAALTGDHEFVAGDS